MRRSGRSVADWHGGHATLDEAIELTGRPTPRRRRESSRPLEPGDARRDRPAADRTADRDPAGPRRPPRRPGPRVVRRVGRDRLRRQPGARCRGQRPAPAGRARLAQMLSSLDHVGRVVAEGPGRERRDAVDRWIARTRREFLAAARTARHRTRVLVAAFEVEQECRELVYAARFLPRWRYAPLATLRARYGVTAADRATIARDEPARLPRRPRDEAAVARTCSRIGSPSATRSRPRRATSIGSCSSGWAARATRRRWRARICGSRGSRPRPSLRRSTRAGRPTRGRSWSRSRRPARAPRRSMRSSATAGARRSSPSSTTRPRPSPSRADVVVEMGAGEEVGGVACRTFQHTGLLLRALESHLTGLDDDLVGLTRQVAHASARPAPDEQPTWLPS